MATWICKVSMQSGQFRLTVPKGLVSEMGWHEVNCVLIRKATERMIEVRRFTDAESLKDEGTGDLSGQD